MKDEEIVELYFSRSEDAISETALKYGNYCSYISQNILHSKEDAEECVNDAYFAAWKTIPPQKPQNLKTFLGKLTRNISLKKQEKYQAAKRGGGYVDTVLSELEECIASNSSIEDSIDYSALIECINSFLSSLPSLNRIVFVRRYWYVSPISEIAEQYNISESKVKSILFRLRKRLKEYLGKEGFFI